MWLYIIQETDYKYQRRWLFFKQKIIKEITINAIFNDESQAEKYLIELINRNIPLIEDELVVFELLYFNLKVI